MHISELPLKQWTQDYKTFLEDLITGDPKKNEAPLIKDFKENHTDTTVSFTITLEAAKIDEMVAKNELDKVFKLTSSLSTGNMHLFNEGQCIQKYETPEEVIEEFFKLRLDFYEKRKACLVDKLQNEQKMLKNKARFVDEVCNGTLVVSNRRRADLLSDLKERGYDLLNKPSKNSETSNEEDEEDDSMSDAELAKGYEYLLGMKIWSLTFEKAEKLRAQLAEKTQELEALLATAPSELWMRDLSSIEELLDERDCEIQAALSDEKNAQKKGKAQRATKKKPAASKKGGKKKKADEWDSDAEEEVDSDLDVEIIPKQTVSRQRKQPKESAAKKSTITAVAKTIPAKKPKEEVDVMQVDDIELSLADRMKKRMVISPPAKKPSSLILDDGGVSGVKKAMSIDLSAEEDSEHSRGKKRPSPKSSDDDDDDVVEITSKPSDGKKTYKRPAAKKAKKPAPSKATGGRGKAKKPVLEDSDDDEFAFDSDVEEVPAPRAPAASNRRTARTQTKKATYVYNDDSDLDSDDSEY